MTRVLLNGLRIHFVQLSRSAFDILGMTAWPVLNATMAYYLFGIGGNPRVLFSASLGATVMAIWASVTTGSSGALDFQRRLGTLELLVAAPVPFLAILAPITIATASIGIYALAGTLLWGRFVFGIPLHVVHPALFVLALPVAVIAIGMLGLVIATTVIVYRQALFLGNSFEYPGFLITGLLVPLSVLPGWVTPIAWLLAPTWGMRAIRHAAFGGSALPDLAVCFGLSVAYLAVAAVCLRGLEYLARVTRDARPLVNWLRVFFVGGLTSFRALFGWLNPYIYVPMLVITPLFQMLFFAYLGRTSHAESDTYFVVGNAFIAASLPGLWGTGWGIAGERRTQTLGTLLSSPASRLALFLGRALPPIANGFVVAAFCFAAGRALLRFDPPLSSLPGLALATLIAAFSCSALGLSIGAVGLRGRNVTALNNIVLIVFLIGTGANVPLQRLPGWVQAVSAFLPLTHAIKAAREILVGGGVQRAGRLLLTELAVGAAYTCVGVVALKLFELESRRSASLETF